MEVEYGTNWARRAAEQGGYETEWARGSAAADTVTPAFGLPVYVPRPERTAAPGGSGGSGGSGDDAPATWLWLLLGLAAGLFWIPLARAAGPGVDLLSGTGLIAALPPVTLTAGVLLVVLHVAVVSLRRIRPTLTAAILLVTFVALHTAPPLLGIHPDPAGGPGAGPVPDAALPVLPVVAQGLCLLLVAALLRLLGAGGRITACAVWVLLWAGWAGQHAFAAAPLPVLLGLCGAVMAAVAGRGLSRR
jgi:hypothetical protein